MNRAAFYKALRDGDLYNSIRQSTVSALEIILNDAEAHHTPIDHIAYQMATAYHEVGPDLIPIRENLTYTSAARIRQVFGAKRFPSLASAQPYVRQPQKLANKVYNGRYGNATNGNDGWNYRGGGLAQTTFKDNYRKVGEACGYDLVRQPELILNSQVAAIALCAAMRDGIYTGRKLSDYKTGDYYNMRDIINADKKANGNEIANYAKSFEKALRMAGYSA